MGDVVARVLCTVQRSSGLFLRLLMIVVILLAKTAVRGVMGHRLTLCALWRGLLEDVDFGVKARLSCAFLRSLRRGVARSLRLVLLRLPRAMVLMSCAESRSLRALSQESETREMGITPPKRKVPRKSRFLCHHKTGIPGRHSSSVCFTLIVLWRAKTGGRGQCARRETAGPPVRRVGRRGRLRGKGTVVPSPLALSAPPHGMGRGGLPSHDPIPHEVARTWGKGKGRGGAGCPRAPPSARTGWRGDGRGGRCALVHPFRANGAARSG
ncbi:hypothetical protein EDB84DRAFT_1679691 [Lactarius hengduanensis]|nr:hypothetical protein EDB84DRAFT_1679691 [Lactarius hengduanensis]